MFGVGVGSFSSRATEHQPRGVPGKWAVCGEVWSARSCTGTSFVLPAPGGPGGAKVTEAARVTRRALCLPATHTAPWPSLALPGRWPSPQLPGLPADPRRALSMPHFLSPQSSDRAKAATDTGCPPTPRGWAVASETGKPDTEAPWAVGFRALQATQPPGLFAL